MSWGELFDRAAEHEVSVAAVRETLAEHRGAEADSAPDDGGDDEH